MSYLVLDWGGVFIENFFERYTRKTYNAMKSYTNLPSLNEYRREVKSAERPYLRGEETSVDFWRKLLEWYGAEITSQRIGELQSRFISSVKLQEDVFEFMHSLRPENTIGLISNTYEEMKVYFKENSDLFDFIVLSCDYGVTKPDRRIYEIALQQLEELERNVKKEDIIFLDDKMKNVEAARNFGMTSHQFTDLQSLRKSLRELYPPLVRNA